MKTSVRHSLSLLVAVALTGFLLPEVWRLACDEWFVRNVGSFYDPWYQKDFLRATATLLVCDALRQALLGRMMFVRIVAESLFVIIGVLRFRDSFFPVYVILFGIGGSVTGLVAACIEEVYAITSSTDRDLTQNKHPTSRYRQGLSLTQILFHIYAFSIAVGAIVFYYYSR